MACVRYWFGAGAAKLTTSCCSGSS